MLLSFKNFCRNKKQRGCFILLIRSNVRFVDKHIKSGEISIPDAKTIALWWGRKAAEDADKLEATETVLVEAANKAQADAEAAAAPSNSGGSSNILDRALSNAQEVGKSAVGGGSSGAASALTKDFVEEARRAPSAAPAPTDASAPEPPSNDD